jgi:hypothetical protein
MKTHRLFILINQLEEINSDTLPRVHQPKISVADLLSIRKKDSIHLSMEDIFIGSKATWKNIKERIEEYLELSILRDGQLEIIYYSVFDSLTRLYTNDADYHFHFYDDCIHRKEIEQIINNFPSSFTCEFKNRSGETQKEKVLEVETKKAMDDSYFNLDFLSIKSKSLQLQTV